MACVFTPQCNFLYGYFWCQLLEDTIDLEVTVRTMKGIHSFRRDHSTQIISCKPWTPNHCPYSSLTKKMRTYLELKDQAADSPYPSPNYPERTKMPSSHKEQNNKKETKKRAKSKQGKKQYNVWIGEKPHVLPAMSAAPIPTSTSTTTPRTTNPIRVSTLWPSTVLASANLFVTRQWAVASTQENGQAPSKQENVLVRKVTFTIPSAMGGPTSASNSTTATAMQSPEKKSEKCKPFCTICAQLAACPSLANPNWSEENKYYCPPEPKYICSYKEMI